MAYLAGDNNGLQSYLNDDLNEMIKGTNNNMRIIALFDTQNQTSMYEITKNNKRTIYGGEIFPEIKKDKVTTINTGNPEYLKKFINFCKKNYSAKKYSLIIGGHGNGVYEDSRGSSKPSINKNVAVDGTSQDWIYTSELTSTLTEEQSVDLLVLDVCIGAFIETLYEYRPRNDGFSAKYAFVSLVEQRDTGLPYNMIFSQVTPTMSAIDFGKLIVKEKWNYDKDNPWYTSRTNYQADALIDMSKIESLKNQIDNVVAELTTTDAKKIYEECVGQANEYNVSDRPARDAYQIFTNLANWEPTTEITTPLSAETKQKCANIANALADCVISSFIQDTSYYGSTTQPFENNKNGLTIFAPVTKYQWENALSYNYIDSSEILNTAGPGQYQWCIDNATIDNYIVENWFELLDYYYDTEENLNGYHY